MHLIFIKCIIFFAIKVTLVRNKMIKIEKKIERKKFKDEKRLYGTK